MRTPERAQAWAEGKGEDKAGGKEQRQAEDGGPSPQHEPLLGKGEEGALGVQEEAKGGKEAEQAAGEEAEALVELARCQAASGAARRACEQEFARRLLGQERGEEGEGASVEALKPLLRTTARAVQHVWCGVCGVVWCGNMFFGMSAININR